MAKFAQNFWCTDFCSTTAFDALLKRLKEGKRTAVDVEEFLEKRGRIEKEYSDSLFRLAKSFPGKDEIGTLKVSWEQLKSETESVGKHHQLLSARLVDEAHALKDFYLQQKESRRRSEDTVKKAASHKKNCFDRNTKLKASYEAKCKEADKNEENYSRMQSNPAAKPKDLQSSQKRMEGSRAAANNSDVGYQEAVKNLEESRQLWEREMELLCRQFQDLEEKRIAYLRHVMWSYCNYCSQTTVDEDDSYENIRKTLEQCNVDNDIDQFVQERATGSERPAAIPYFNFYHPTAGGDTLGLRTPVNTSMGPSKIVHKELPPIPVQEKPLEEGVYSSVDDDLKIATTESYYAAPSSVPAADTGRGSNQMIVLYDYTAQGPQEISLVEDEIIEVLEKEDDLWWCGKKDDGQTGMFPSTYVEAIDEGEETI